MRLLSLALGAALFLSACTEDYASQQTNKFMARLAAHCGHAYEGRVVSTDPQDETFAKERLVIHVRECTPGEIRIPLHVGDDRSRTWVVTQTEKGLRLKHDHRHEDGDWDAVTYYGGESAKMTKKRVEFPVDQHSIELFEREGLTASVTNVWALEVTDKMFAYELRRENRFFRAEFDLSAPVDTPPVPWGVIM